MTFDQGIAAALASMWVLIHLQWIHILTHKSLREYWLGGGREFLFSKLLFIGALAACALMALIPSWAGGIGFFSLCLMLGHSLTASIDLRP